MAWVLTLEQRSQNEVIQLVNDISLARISVRLNHKSIARLIIYRIFDLFKCNCYRARIRLCLTIKNTLDSDCFGGVVDYTSELESLRSCCHYARS